MQPAISMDRQPCVQCVCCAEPTGILGNVRKRGNAEPVPKEHCWASVRLRLVPDDTENPEDQLGLLSCKMGVKIPFLLLHQGSAMIKWGAGNTL